MLVATSWAEEPAPAAGKNELRMSKGLVASILSHADALNLTAEQKTELASIQALREKIDSDPQIKALFTELQDAIAAKEEEKIPVIVEKISARKAELGAAKDTKSAMDVLTPEQRKKYNELTKAARPAVK